MARVSDSPVAVLERQLLLLRDVFQAAHRGFKEVTVAAADGAVAGLSAHC